MKSAVILLSGGLDSATLLRYVKRRLGYKRIQALTFHYGQKHFRETECAAWQADSAGVQQHRQVDLTCFHDLIAGSSALTDAAITVPDLRSLTTDQLDQPPTYVPNRNMVFLALAAAFAEASAITNLFFGAQTQDRYGYWDCTSEFLERINATLGLNRRRPVVVRAPFIRLHKHEVLKIGLALGVDYAHTWSCYRGAAQPCGKCPSCVERRAAFDALKVADPLADG